MFDWDDLRIFLEARRPTVAVSSLILPGLAPTLASSSIRTQREMILAGGDVGVLPCFLAEGLVRVLPGEVLLERRFWLSTTRCTRPRSCGSCDTG